jgi:hypothetical protein
MSTPYVTGAAALLASACPLPPPAIVATLEGSADQIPALAPTATNGRRLNLGNALASCAGGGHTPGTASLQLRFYSNPSNPDTGTISVTIDNITSSYSYDSSYQDTDSVGEGIAAIISDFGYVQGTYEGGGTISLTTNAVGPFTQFSLSASVENDCDPPSECGRAPSLTSTPFTAGH